MSDLIDREKTIQVLSRWEWLCDWNDYVREHAPDTGPVGLVEIMPSAEQKWIPVSERLPETDDMMLVSCRTKKGDNNVNRAYFDGSFWHGSGSMSGVVAWMPMPEPYEGV